MYQCLHEDQSSTPAERDNQETELISELHTLGKALELFVLLEVSMSPFVLLRHVGVELHLLCGYPDQPTVLFVLDTWSDMRESVHKCQEANTLHQLCLLVDTELIVTPMIHGSTFELHESQLFIITVFLTAPANAVPEARSDSPTSSSQALKSLIQNLQRGHTRVSQAS